jgi:hypothetical protein
MLWAQFAILGWMCFVIVVSLFMVPIHLLRDDAPAAGKQLVGVLVHAAFGGLLYYAGSFSHILGGP